MISLPLDLPLTFLIGYLSKTKPFKVFYYGIMAHALLSIYTVYVLLYTFPKDNMTNYTIIHVIIITLIT